MAENLGLALVQLFGDGLLDSPELAELAAFGDDSGQPLAIPDIITGAETSALSIEELVVVANDQFVRAQEYARAGDWAGYGEEIAALEATLARLAELTGVQPLG